MTDLLRRGCAAAIALLLGACAAIPADHHKVAQHDAAALALAPDIALGGQAWPSAHWWSSYADPQLDALIERALQSHPSLEVARARLDAAGASLDYNKAQAGAAVGLGADLNRQRYSGNGLFPAPIGGAYYNDVALQLKASYDFDWWGKHRAQIAAALGEFKARLADQAQAEQVLAAALAQSYFRLQSLWARAANAAALADTERAIVADKARRVANGLARADEQRGAELDLAHVDEMRAQLATEAGREREVLRALAGGATDALAGLAPRGAPEQAHALPAKLGLALLARRPDLQAARYRVESMLGEVEAARTAFYPDINLSAAFGLDAVSLGTLLRPNSRTLLVGGALSLPLFDSGRLGAQLNSLRAQRDEVIADYNRSVLGALGEVAQEGITLQGSERQLQAQAASADASAALLRNARQRLQQGLADKADVLQAELLALRQLDNRLMLLAQQRQGEIALVKALGGGYQADASSSTLTTISAASTAPAPSLSSARQ
jgi:multidrug efflux system outer membrane protein